MSAAVASSASFTGSAAFSGFSAITGSVFGASAGASCFLSDFFDAGALLPLLSSLTGERDWDFLSVSVDGFLVPSSFFSFSFCFVQLK